MANTTIKLSIGDVDEPTLVIIVKGFHKYIRDATSPVFKFPENAKIVNSKVSTANLLQR